MDFTKPASTWDEQIELLRSRGLEIPDLEQARHYLSHINYYRLTGYWLPFEADHSIHRFKARASFDDVLNLYIFDREFRLLLLDAIERIEVSLRRRERMNGFVKQHHIPTREMGFPDDWQ